MQRRTISGAPAQPTDITRNYADEAESRRVRLAADAHRRRWHIALQPL